MTPRKGERGETQVLRSRATSHKGEERKRPSSAIHPPSPTQEASSEAGEIMRRIAEAEQLEGVGRSLSSSPTCQLAQMAAEAGPSKLGGKELACKKLLPTMGGKAPPEGVITGWQSKETQEVPA